MWRDVTEHSGDRSISEGGVDCRCRKRGLHGEGTGRFNGLDGSRTGIQVRLFGMGGLIQAAVGFLGGIGGLLTKRLGFCWNAMASVAWRAA